MRKRGVSSPGFRRTIVGLKKKNKQNNHRGKRKFQKDYSRIENKKDTKKPHMMKLVSEGL